MVTWTRAAALVVASCGVKFNHDVLEMLPCSVKVLAEAEYKEVLYVNEHVSNRVLSDNAIVSPCALVKIIATRRRRAL